MVYLPTDLSKNQPFMIHVGKIRPLKTKMAV